MTNFNNYQPTNYVQNKTPSSISNSTNNQKQTFMLNNYQPELTKKNINNQPNQNTGLLSMNRSNNQNYKGPVK